MAGGTETVAVKNSDGGYKLFGYKFFSSATDADIALTLARIVDPSTGKPTPVYLLIICYLHLVITLHKHL